MFAYLIVSEIMGPIQVKDSVRSNSVCIENDKFGVVVAITTTERTNKEKKKVTYHVMWEDFKISLPHSRKSLSRDHTLRELANGEVYKNVQEKELAKMENPNDVSFSDDDDDVDLSSREYKPIYKDYYYEKKEKTRMEAEKAAAEEIELDRRLEANLKVNTTEYKSPDITNTIFANYLQHKHKLASDYSDGPCYIFLPFKIVT